MTDNNVAKKLRLTQKGYENYSGPIGEYEFVNGVSVELIPLVARDRLSAAFQMAEIDDGGNEEPSGAAHRLISERNLTIEPTVSLKRQTTEEKEAELQQIITGTTSVIPLYTQEAIEKVASERGISGLRVLASAFGVKSKSIPDLIVLILNAQNDYDKSLRSALTAKGIAETKINEMMTPLNEVPNSVFEPKVEPVVEPKAETTVAETSATEVTVETPVAETVAETTVTEAATTGNLAAAVSE